MIVCSCNLISKSEIEEVINDFLDEDPWNLITPGRVYHALGKRGRCCGCFPGLTNIIIDMSEQYHQAIDTPTHKLAALISQIKENFVQFETGRKLVANRCPEFSYS